MIPAPASAGPGAPRLVEVLRPGPLATVQDLGRPGLAHLAVPRSGAADPDSLRLANRLVGNPESAAGIETTLLGADLLVTAARWVAVTGAPCPVRVDGRPADTDRPVYVPAGAVLSIGPASRGVRSYLAVAGGIDTVPALGSRSTDLLSGIGPPPLSAGQTLPIGPAGRGPAPVDLAPRRLIPDEAWLRLIAGPRDGWFDGAALRAIAGTRYRVDSASNRIGVRLTGPPVSAARHRELPSEGAVLGAVQVPPGGRPVIFLVDHPTTGGYPVVGAVHPDDMWLVAQARPGTSVRFRWTSAG